MMAWLALTLFSNEHSLFRSAPSVMIRFRDSISKYGTKSVTLVGHSFGGVLALLDITGQSSRFNCLLILTGFGTPRAGNSKFANYVDQNS
jgi:triacylglycerol esterase/lipase EstA (alpha/beta hydrolase family)